jgi:LemA protein
MKSIGCALAALVFAVLAFFGLGFVMRNGIIASDETAKQAWGNVESAYQRRLDLIPNLVSTVEGATKYEGETLVKITEARNTLLGLAREQKSALAERDTGKVDATEGALLPAVRAFTGLATEAYPQLKATDQFTSLQAELAGTENRINVARRDYNEAVAALNTRVRQWGFLPFCGGVAVRRPFEAQAAAAEAPKVKFGP